MGQRPTHEAIFMSMSKKAEKIATALYLVTDFIDGTDPMKQRIRTCGIDLIALTRSMTHGYSGDVYFMVGKAIDKAWELVSLIEVSASIGFLSDMNARILRTVLVELISSLRDKQRREGFADLEDMKIGESMADQVVLSKNLFDVEDSTLSLKGQNIKDRDKSDKKDKIFEDKKAMPATSLAGPKTRPVSSASKPSRRQRILDIIREKGQASVGDFTASFPDVSQKTIQRELLALVEEGLVKKEGEKRWSKYSLNGSASESSMSAM